MSPKPRTSRDRRTPTSGMFPPWTRLGDRRGKSPIVSPIVTIFGAGISGLSAAHELIERGFSVQVVEPATSYEEEYAAEVGGMAANQFGRVREKPEVLHRRELAEGDLDTPEQADEDARARFRDNVGRVLLRRSAAMQLVQPRFATPWRIQFARNGDSKLDESLVDEWGGQNLAKLVAALDTFKAAIRTYQQDVTGGAAGAGAWVNGLGPEWQRRETLRVELRGHTNRDDTEQNNRLLSLKWAQAVRKSLVTLNTSSVDPIEHIEDHFICVAVGSAEPLGDQREAEWRRRSNRVEFRIIEQLVPGEHGYRFFPAFYRHLFDTMRRTPILNQHDQETGETAFDRLVPTQDVGLGLRDGRSSVSIQTRRLRSLEEFRKHSQAFFERLGATFRDIARFEVRMLKFLTSSSERRRRECEGRTWWSFIGGDVPLGYSEKMKKYLTEAPQALVAMNAEETDARSQGNIVSQLKIHYLENRFDSTLNGPTTRVWLREWKRYLERQGVRFFVGELGKLDWDGAELVPVTTHRSGWLAPRRRQVNERNPEIEEKPVGIGSSSGEPAQTRPGKPSTAPGKVPEASKAVPPRVRPAQQRIKIDVMGNDDGDYTVFLDGRACSVAVDKAMKAADIARQLRDRLDEDPAVSATVHGSRITITEAREVSTAEGEDLEFDGSYIAGTWKEGKVRRIKYSAVTEPPTPEVAAAVSLLETEPLDPTNPLTLEDDAWTYAGTLRARDPNFNEKLSKYEQSQNPRCETVPRITIEADAIKLAPPAWVEEVSRTEGDRASNFAPLFPYYFRTRRLAPILVRVQDPHGHLRIVDRPMPEDPEHTYLSHEESHAEYRPDFYVLALPFDAASRLVWQAESERSGQLDGCLAELLKFDICAHRRSQSGRLLTRTRDVHGRPAKDDPLRDFSGVQYYFHNQVRIGKGHIYFPDAEWGLSSISQLAYWRERMSSSGAFMGQLSVDIGNFYATAPPRAGGRFTWSAWNSTADEIAREVWFQVRQGLEKDRAGVLSDPDYVHLDDGLRFNHALGSSFREETTIVVARAIKERVVEGKDKKKVKVTVEDLDDLTPYTIWINGECFRHTPAVGESASAIALQLCGLINESTSGSLAATTPLERPQQEVRPSAILGMSGREAIALIQSSSERQLDDLQDELNRAPHPRRRRGVLRAIYERRRALEISLPDPEAIVGMDPRCAIEMVRAADASRLDLLAEYEKSNEETAGGRPEVLKAIETRRSKLAAHAERRGTPNPRPAFSLHVRSRVSFEGAIVRVTGMNAGSYEVVIDGKPYRYMQPLDPADRAAGRQAIRDALFHQIVLDPDAAVIPEASGTHGLVLLPKGLNRPAIVVRNEHQNLTLVFGPRLHVRLEQSRGGLSFAHPEEATVGYNQTPFLINVPGQWRHRPGVVNPGSDSPAIGPGDTPATAVSYNISNRRWVAAGTYMATTTRLTTMESANESARHAVNAILYHLVAGPEGSYSGQGQMFADWADIWDPERHELDDLEPLKRLDEQLVKEGLPHVFDILKIVEAVDALPMHGQESRDPMGNVMHLFEHVGKSIGGDWSFAKELLSGVLAQGAERMHAQLDPLGVLRGLKEATPADLTDRLQRAIKSFMQAPDK